MVNTRSNTSRIPLRSAANQGDDMGSGSHHNNPPRQTDSLPPVNPGVGRENPPTASPPTMAFDAATIEVLREMMVQVAQAVVSQVMHSTAPTGHVPPIQ